MKKFTKILCVFFAFSSILYTQDYVARNVDINTDINTGRIYNIGTGLSFSFGSDFGLTVDSYHFFSILDNHRIFLKLGMGAYAGIVIPEGAGNVDSSNLFSHLGAGFIVSASVGYMYVLYGWNPEDSENIENYNDGPSRLDLGNLDQIGFGFSLDYNYANLTLTNHINTLGGTFYLKLDNFLIGLGAGMSLKSSNLSLALVYDGKVVLPLSASPYAKVSLGFLF